MIINSAKRSILVIIAIMSMEIDCNQNMSYSDSFFIDNGSIQQESMPTLPTSTSFMQSFSMDPDYVAASQYQPQSQPLNNPVNLASAQSQSLMNSAYMPQSKPLNNPVNLASSQIPPLLSSSIQNYNSPQMPLNHSNPVPSAPLPLPTSPIQSFTPPTQYSPFHVPGQQISGLNRDMRNCRWVCPLDSPHSASFPSSQSRFPYYNPMMTSNLEYPYRSNPSFSNYPSDQSFSYFPPQPSHPPFSPSFDSHSSMSHLIPNRGCIETKVCCGPYGPRVLYARPIGAFPSLPPPPPYFNSFSPYGFMKSRGMPRRRRPIPRFPFAKKRSSATHSVKDKNTMKEIEALLAQLDSE